MDDRPRQWNRTQLWMLVPLLLGLMLFAGMGMRHADNGQTLSLTEAMPRNLTSSASILAGDGELLVAADPFAHTPEDAVRRSVLSSAIKRTLLPGKHGAPAPDLPGWRVFFLPVPSRLHAVQMAISPLPLRVPPMLSLPGPRGPAFYAMPPPMVCQSLSPCSGETTLRA